MHGCRAACVVAWGVCVVVGGMHGCWGHALLWGACMVVEGHAWLPGGMCGCGGGACVGYDEIRSMSGRYASYWECILVITKETKVK